MKILCKKYKKQLTALENAPLPGEIGQKILKNYSKEAWENWLTLQTMLINEKMLNLTKPDHKAYLKEQMLLFLENKNFDTPTGYKPKEPT